MPDAYAGAEFSSHVKDVRFEESARDVVDDGRPGRKRRFGNLDAGGVDGDGNVGQT